ncbi:MAG: hypothetical protein GVY08_11975 [Bacteroidetes bacterium]|jgi:hypothetical protein|nr:hypothetical protein [Bacteroidota bacterium]
MKLTGTACSTLGIGDVLPQWKNLGYEITVKSSAPEQDVMRVLDLAHRESHVRGDFEHAFDVKQTVTINEPQKSVTNSINSEKFL